MAGPPKIISIFFLVCLSEVRSSDHSLVVETMHGPVKGVTQQSATGKAVDAWYGIPYAMPPSGDLRFRHPFPIGNWNETKDTNKPPNSCWQTLDDFFGDFEGTTMWNANTPMSEDCLYISVFVPKPRKKNRAVLVWLFGGGFYAGTTTLDVYDYKTLAAEQDVILVAPQYRVASLGFLYMGTSDVPGNAGLFDQLMALEWIRDNIELFGGNRDNITLFGESAGATSISMLLLSPLSRNLFSQAIMQSGAATVPWGIVNKQESIIRGLLMAQNLNCPHNKDNMKEVIECLRDVNASALVENDPQTNISEFPFVPIIDGSFLREHPVQSLKTGNLKKTNIMMGSNAEEGNWFIMYTLTNLFRRVENVTVSRKDFKMAVKNLYPYFGELVQEAIMYEYTNWLNPNDGNANRDAIDKMVGDYHYLCNVNEFAYQYAYAGNNVYMYYFTHRSSQNKWPKWAGVLHGDEIPYLFGQPLNPKKKYKNNEADLSRRMMTYWANFAKTGSPSEGTDGRWTSTYWPVHTVTGREYIILNANHISTGKGLRLKKCAFWKHYIPKLVRYADKSRVKDPEQCLREPTKSKENIIQAETFLLTALMFTSIVILSLH